MTDGNLLLKKINSLGSKANEFITKNKILSNQLSYYQKIFTYNKNYITSYFNILAESKKIAKINNNNKNSYINNIKDIIIKYHSEIKEDFLTSKQKLKNAKLKNNTYLSKLMSETKNISEYYEKICEDNFLYDNAIKAKENFIVCLKNDLNEAKKKSLEDKRHIYLKYNSQIIYKVTNQNQMNTNNKIDKIDKNDTISFEEGETEIKDILLRERHQFVLKMKLRNDIRLKYSKMNLKKNALNDLVTSISFINKTEIIPSKNNNIFQLLNKKIGGVINNYEKNFNEDEDNIDENYFIFLPFEIEINKKEINELVETDITLPNTKLQSKSINEYKKKNNKHTKNRSFINVPNLNFLQIEFNKEKINYSDSDNEEKKDENIKDDKKEEITKNEKNKNSKKKNEEMDLKIKQMKKDIRYYKKKNKKLKSIIKDFETFQEKIKDKFIIFEKKILNEKKQKLDY